MDTLLKSCLCTQAQLESEPFQKWAVQLREPQHVPWHRKVWEWAYITQALHERNLLKAGARGLGFAVGREPLSAFFANYGCAIVATDLFEEQARQAGWVETNQYAANVESLNTRGFCDPELFRQRVIFRHVDMNAIPDDLRGFDFIWSSCSLEHLGSLNRGEQFIYKSLECLRPGGIAVHTTEFNISSNSRTLDRGPTVLFRKRDLHRIANRLRREGHTIDLLLQDGQGVADKYVDPPPYKQEVHLKLLLDKYVVTSVGLIIQKRLYDQPQPFFLHLFQRRNRPTP